MLRDAERDGPVRANAQVEVFHALADDAHGNLESVNVEGDDCAHRCGLLSLICGAAVPLVRTC